MNINEFNKSMSSLYSRVTSNVKSTLFEQAQLIRHDLQERSPIDTGLFKSSWVLSRMSGSGSSLSIAIRNSTPYGHWLDEGGIVKGPPWYFPKDGAKRTGKLAVRNGKVWAGGLSPSGFVSPGITKVIVENRKIQVRAAKALADAIIGAV